MSEEREKALDAIRDIVQAIAKGELGSTYVSDLCRRKMRDHYPGDSEWTVFQTFQKALPELKSTLAKTHNWKDVPGVLKDYIEGMEGSIGGGSCPCISKQCTWPGSWYCQDPKYKDIKPKGVE